MDATVYVGEDSSIALSVARDGTWLDHMFEALVAVESDDAGLVCHFLSLNNVDQCYMAVLRVAEGVFVLEAVQGETWARLQEAAYDLSLSQQYNIRVHYFRGYLMFFLDGAYMFMASNIGFKSRKIGAVA